MSFEPSVAALNGFCEYLGAPFLVALFYWFRFHTRKGTRSYTTLFLYCIGVIAFVLPFLLTYFFIYYLVGEPTGFGAAAHPEPAAGEHAKNISALSAMCLVMLAWLLPWAPERWRDFCQGMARIPFYARAMRDTLRNAAWELRPNDWQDVSRKLGRVGYRIDDLRAVQAAPIQSRFLKIATIMHHLELLKLEGNAFLDRNAEQYANLLAVYDLLSFKAIRALKNTSEIYGAIMEDSKVQPDDWRALDSFSARNDSSNRLQSIAQIAAGTVLEDLRKDMDLFLDDLLLLTVRSVLATEWNFAGCKRRLGMVGFTVPEPSYAAVWMTLAALGISVATIVVWLITIHNPSDLIAGNKAAGLTRTFVVSPANIIVSILMVYHMKRNYAFANEGVFGGLPWKFIFTIGLAIALLILPLQVVFDHYQFRMGQPVGTEDVYNSIRGLPVLIYMWATGSIVALLAQDSIWNRPESERAKRVRDGLAFGAAWTFAVALLFAINHISPIPVMEKMANEASNMIVGLVATFLAGFVFGYCMMSFVREAASLRAMREDATSGAAWARG